MVHLMQKHTLANTNLDELGSWQGALYYGCSLLQKTIKVFRITSQCVRICFSGLYSTYSHYKVLISDLVQCEQVPRFDPKELNFDPEVPVMVIIGDIVVDTNYLKVIEFFLIFSHMACGILKG